MAVTITQNPGTYNLAYGVNPVTLSGIAPTSLKYVLQVKDYLGNIVADVRQAPNASGKALFDIQNILQSYVQPSAAGVESSNFWTRSNDEVFQYILTYGEENSSGALIIGGTSTGYKVVGGRKVWNDITWSDASDYRQWLTQNGGCTTVQSQGLLLSDYPTVQSAASLPGTVPSYITAKVNAQCYVVDIRPDQDWSLSFLQEPIKVGTVTANNITAVRVTSYDSSGTQVDSFKIDNYVSNGGGPDLFPGDNAPMSTPYWAMSLAVGPANGPIAAQLSPNVAYYYVTFHAYQVTACSTPRQYPNVTEIPSMVAYRFNIVQGDCNDFDPVYVSWNNSFGFRDYWQFTKRWDESYSAQRNEYLTNTFNWNGTAVSIPEGARGSKVFNQKLQQTYTITTDWLTDEQSEYLKNLFLSSDVRVRLPGSQEWESVSLESNSYTVQTIRKNRMFQYELRFRMANNLNSQRG